MLGESAMRLTRMMMMLAQWRKASHPVPHHLHLLLELHTEGEELWSQIEEDSPEGGPKTFSGRKRDYETECMLAALMPCLSLLLSHLALTEEEETSQEGEGQCLLQMRRPQTDALTLSLHQKRRRI